MVALAAVALFPLLSAASDGPVRLFDGRTLNGWEQGDHTSFRIEHGMIVGGQLSGPIARKTFLCTTKSYGDFRLTARFKLVGADDANTGIQIRTRRLDAASEVSGYQADAGQIFWGTLFDEGRRKEKLARGDQDKLRPFIHFGGWNRYEIIAQGRHIVLKLNGIQTVDYTEPDPAIPQTGLICLQVHNGGPMLAWFKDLALTPL
jgi:hypothetical protein